MLLSVAFLLRVCETEPSSTPGWFLGLRGGLPWSGSAGRKWHRLQGCPWLGWSPGAALAGNCSAGQFLSDRRGHCWGFHAARTPPALWMSLPLDLQEQGSYSPSPGCFHSMILCLFCVYWNLSGLLLLSLL